MIRRLVGHSFRHRLITDRVVMLQPRAPTPLAAILSLVPPPVLARLVAMLTRSMRRRHPQLISAFARLDPAVMHVELVDVPRRFVIAFGGGRMDLRMLRAADPLPANATIRGSLAALVDLLEGRIDGDTLFFTRQIEITGSTAVIVAVRNTLDREEIIMRDEIAALFGPLERPARRIARRVDRVAGRVRSQLAATHAQLHAMDVAPQHSAAEFDALREEVKALSARLARLDVRQMRAAATTAPTS